jgi:excisionase family DNA binding protein
MRLNMHVEQKKSEPMEEMTSRERLLTIREAAQYLAVSVSTLYGWVWQRRIPFVKIGRALRFDLHDLAAFIEANKQTPRKAVPNSNGRPNPCYNARAAGKG